MTPEQKLIRIVDGARGDDLERARRAYKGLTPELMALEYGQSGKTCAEILKGYEDERQEWQAARDLLHSLLSATVK